jgi:hypothetical protein
MDVFVLDENLRRLAIIDIYKSFLWTERLNEWGDFKLEAHYSRSIRSQLPVGTMLAIPHSMRVMKVETQEVKRDDEGNNIITFSGRSLEALLDDRAVFSSLGSLDATPTWPLQGPPADLLRAIFIAICEEGLLSPDDIIPFYVPGTITPPGDILEPSEDVLIDIEPQSLYELTKNLAQIYNLGFRFVRDDDLNQLHYEIYTGTDHTTSQTDNPAVIFSRALDSLSGLTEIQSDSTEKNVAYVFGKYDSAIVFASGSNSALSTGFNRKVLTVKADDIDLPVGSELTAALEARGRQELAQNRAILGFDGETPQIISYIYDQHYSLGDLVEVHDTEGNANQVRVTEQIFASDAEGDRSYPTFIQNQFVRSGSWLAYDGPPEWADVPDTSSFEWKDM